MWVKKGATNGVGITRRVVEMKKTLPTAAFLLLHSRMRITTTNTLRPHAMMFAIFPTEPFVPALGIPHDGFMPTGADVESAEAPCNVVLDTRKSCKWNE
jgi:hypothetical protein